MTSDQASQLITEVQVVAEAVVFLAGVVVGTTFLSLIWAAFFRQ